MKQDSQTIVCSQQSTAGRVRASHWKNVNSSWDPLKLVRSMKDKECFVNRNYNNVFCLLIFLGYSSCDINVSLIVRSQLCLLSRNKRYTIYVKLVMIRHERKMYSDCAG